MENVYLIRTSTSEQGTEGMLVTGGFQCFTLELPWKENRQNISCIPSGEYIVKIRKSPRFGEVYHIKDVEGRSYILIHSGNVAGDVSKGYKSHVNGCVIVGSKMGYLWGQRAVLNSRVALKRFQRFMNNEKFKLHIWGGF